MNYCRYVLCLLAILSVHAYAETRRVNLDECIQIALDNHPKILMAAEDYKKAVSQYDLAKSTRWPSFSADLKTAEFIRQKEGASVNKINLPGRDTTFGVFGGLSGIYNIYNPSKSRLRDAAKFGVDLSRMNEQRMRSNIVFGVKTAYFGYLAASDNYTLREQLRDKYKKKLDNTGLLFNKGQRPILDVTKADVDLATSVLELERGRNQRNLAKTELLISLGTAIDSEIDVVPLNIDNLPKVRFGLEELYKLADTYSIDLRLARLQIDLQKIEIDVERASRSLSVDLIGSFGLENMKIANDYLNLDDDIIGARNWTPSLHVGVQARFPLWDGGAISAKVDKAVADYNVSMYNEKLLLINLRNLIRNYLQVMDELTKQLDLAKSMKANADKHLLLAQKSYDNGLTNLLSLQDAELAMINVDLFSIKAKYEYLITFARLAYAVGLGEDYLCGK